MKIRRFVLICIFFLDVHVKADTKAGKLAECWGKKIPCPVQAEQSKKIITAGEMRIALSPRSLLEQRDEKTIQLVRGQFYVEASEPVVFKSPFAKVWCDGSCKGLFVRTSDKFEIKSLEGRWILQRNGEKSNYQIPEAQLVAVSEVAEDGLATMEFPQSLPWDSTVKQWASLYPGTLGELRTSLATFREIWKEAVEKASRVQMRAASLTIASFENEQAQERAKKAASEHEDQRLRALFRENNP